LRNINSFYYNSRRNSSISNRALVMLHRTKFCNINRFYNNKQHVLLQTSRVAPSTPIVTPPPTIQGVNNLMMTTTSHGGSNNGNSQIPVGEQDETQAKQQIK
jgi:hypothetical protein